MVTSNASTTNISTTDAVTFIEKVAGLLNEYGPLIVILAVFLLVFIGVVMVLMHSHNKMMQSMLDERNAMIKSITGQSDKLIDCIAESRDSNDPKHEDDKAKDSESVKTFANGDDKRGLIKNYIDSNIILKEASRNALEQLGCERVAIYVFHNGNKSIHGLPFFKMSCIHEWYKSGSQAMKTKTIRGITHNEMPLYSFSSMVEDIYNTGKYIVDNVHDECIANDQLRIFTSYSDCKSIYAIAIRDDDGNAAGFIITEFFDQQNFEETGEFVDKVLDRMIDYIKPTIINSMDVGKKAY